MQEWTRLNRFSLQTRLQHLMSSRCYVNCQQLPAVSQLQRTYAVVAKFARGNQAAQVMAPTYKTHLCRASQVAGHPATRPIRQRRGRPLRTLLALGFDWNRLLFALFSSRSCLSSCLSSRIQVNLLTEISLTSSHRANGLKRAVCPALYW